MVGLSGVFGGDAHSVEVETVPETIAGGEVADTYREHGVVIRAAFHEGTATDQPAETDDGSLVWIWGEVYSVTDEGGKRRSVDPNESAQVCARQYSAHGLDFVSRLDGEFTGCVYEPAADTVSFFTDRLGARPLYYARGDDGLAFSTAVQTVPVLPGFEPAFDERFLAEYLYCRRTFGTKTPITGLEQLPPATILTCDIESGDTDRRRYWEPRYRPQDRPFSYFVRELTDRFERAVHDRTRDDRDHGLLLSGGSDSRAVLAAADEPLTAFHLGDGWNREARIAKRAADAADSRFELLNRGPNYHATLLERAGPIQEFVGPFHTGHALRFADEIDAEVDTLLTGLYSDDLFGAWSIPQATLQFPFDIQFWFPFERLPSTIDDFVCEQVTAGPTRRPDFLDAAPLEEILRENIRFENGEVEFHGVGYESVEQLGLNSTLYPITNGIGFDLFSAVQIAPTRNPFLDRRLVDLAPLDAPEAPIAPRSAAPSRGPIRRLAGRYSARFVARPVETAQGGARGRQSRDEPVRQTRRDRLVSDAGTVAGQKRSDQNP